MENILPILWYDIHFQQIIRIITRCMLNIILISYLILFMISSGSKYIETKHFEISRDTVFSFSSDNPIIHIKFISGMSPCAVVHIHFFFFRCPQMLVKVILTPNKVSSFFIHMQSSFTLTTRSYVQFCGE